MSNDNQSSGLLLTELQLDDLVGVLKKIESEETWTPLPVLLQQGHEAASQLRKYVDDGDYDGMYESADAFDSVLNAIHSCNFRAAPQQEQRPFRVRPVYSIPDEGWNDISKGTDYYRDCVDSLGRSLLDYLPESTFEKVSCTACEKKQECRVQTSRPLEKDLSKTSKQGAVLCITDDVKRKPLFEICTITQMGDEFKGLHIGEGLLLSIEEVKKMVGLLRNCLPDLANLVHDKLDQKQLKLKNFSAAQKESLNTLRSVLKILVQAAWPTVTNWNVFPWRFFEISRDRHSVCYNSVRMHQVVDVFLRGAYALILGKTADFPTSSLRTRMKRIFTHDRETEIQRLRRELGLTNEIPGYLKIIAKAEMLKRPPSSSLEDSVTPKRSRLNLSMAGEGSCSKNGHRLPLIQSANPASRSPSQQFIDPAVPSDAESGQANCEDDNAEPSHKDDAFSQAGLQSSMDANVSSGNVASDVDVSYAALASHPGSPDGGSGLDSSSCSSSCSDSSDDEATNDKDDPKASLAEGNLLEQTKEGAEEGNHELAITKPNTPGLVSDAKAAVDESQGSDSSMPPGALKAASEATNAEKERSKSLAPSIPQNSSPSAMKAHDVDRHLPRLHQAADGRLPSVRIESRRAAGGTPPNQKEDIGETPRDDRRGKGSRSSKNNKSARKREAEKLVESVKAKQNKKSARSPSHEKEMDERPSSRTKGVTSDAHGCSENKPSEKRCPGKDSDAGKKAQTSSAFVSSSGSEPGGGSLAVLSTAGPPYLLPSNLSSEGKIEALLQLMINKKVEKEKEREKKLKEKEQKKQEKERKKQKKKDKKRAKALRVEEEIEGKK